MRSYGKRILRSVRLNAVIYICIFAALGLALYAGAKFKDEARKRADANCLLFERSHLADVTQLDRTYAYLQTLNPSDLKQQINTFILAQLPETERQARIDTAPGYCDNGFGLPEPDPVVPKRPAYVDKLFRLIPKDAITKRRNAGKSLSADNGGTAGALPSTGSKRSSPAPRRGTTSAPSTPRPRRPVSSPARRPAQPAAPQPAAPQPAAPQQPAAPAPKPETPKPSGPPQDVLDKVCSALPVKPEVCDGR